MQSTILIRPFTPADAHFCHRTRTAAYRELFVDELGAATAAAAAEAYQPDDYIRMARDHECFIIEQGDIPVGFFTIKQHDPATAEIPLIYLDLNHLNKGLGSAALRFAENWLHTHWPAVRELFVDTMIPGYNADFYRKLGFREKEPVSCSFPGVTVPALRLSKQLPPSDE